MTGRERSSALPLRFGATRLCLWRLCGKAACRRARSCRGDARVCLGLLGDWLAALEEEKRHRAGFAPLASEPATLAEARAYLAWRETAGPALSGEREDRGADAMRQDLTRRILALSRPRDAALQRRGPGDRSGKEGV
jgi:hypothetical protein